MFRLGLAAALVSAVARALCFEPGPQALPDEYIVRLRQDLNAEEVQAHVSKLQGVDQVWDFSIKGYSGTFDEATIEKIRSHEDVILVEPNYIVSESATVVQEDAPWGLASLSHRTLGESTCEYDESAGEGTYAYVLDTGIVATHEQFEGRAHQVFSADRFWAVYDHNGHGTHVAGTIAGRTFGVAKKATVFSVKVLHVGSNTESRVITGLEWVVQNITNTPGRAAVSVINMSLGGPFSQTFNDAATAVVDAGIMIVTSAGNNGEDASVHSPASADGVLTVGSADVNGAIWDDGTWASNYGPKVDLFAPGVDVLSASTSAHGDYRYLNGTSMASPHVAGLALYLKALEGLETPQDTFDRIMKLATDREIAGAGPGSPSKWPYNGISV